MAVDRELEAVVAADLESLVELIAQPLTEPLARTISAILRRLLIDNGGTLQRLRRQKGEKGEPTIRSVNMLRTIAPPWSELTLGMAGSIDLGDIVIGDIAVKKGADEWLDLPPADSVVVDEAPLSVFMARACLVVAGRPVSRRLIIQYVANKLGGVHYDTNRNAKDEEFRLLDDNRSLLRFGPGPVDLAYAQMIAIAQHVLRTPEIIDILPSNKRPLHVPDPTTFPTGPVAYGEREPAQSQETTVDPE